jgi:hypothetical protein
MNSIILSPNEIKDLYDSGNYTITITDNKTCNSIKVNILNINENENENGNENGNENENENEDIIPVIEVKDKTNENYIKNLNEYIEQYFYNEKNNIDYDSEDDTESELDEDIDSEIDNDYNTGFDTYMGGPYEIDFTLDNFLQDYVMIKLISSYINNVSVFIKRKKILAIYKYYDNSNPYDDEDIHGNYKYFFKIEKYIGHRLRKEIANHLMYNVNIPGMVKLFTNVPIRLFNTFDIKSLFEANTTHYMKVFYAYM